MVQKQIEKEDGHQGDDEGNGSTKSEVSLIELDRLGAVCLSEKLRQNSYWKHMSKINQLVSCTGQPGHHGGATGGPEECAGGPVEDQGKCDHHMHQGGVCHESGNADRPN